MASQNRFLCVHAHFYQPPRENPWLETVETQPSAAPYHDWNDRITAECYAPNGAARILNAENEIIRIINNYSRISFNFGPTLLSWLEVNTPRVYRAILNADRASRNRFSGHGSAMAQGYNHIILPLANRRDKITQIEWGMADFRSRFNREPEGMWLPETAVDLETLDLMAERGLKFVVLAPGQCKRVRPVTSAHDAGDAEALLSATTEVVSAGWQDTPGDSVTTTRAYRVRLSNGRSIAAFFYDGGRSRAIAFEGLLNSGENFYSRLMGGFDRGSAEPQVVHVATDGESYGHHHRYGEMALAWMLQHVEQTGEAKLTNYGEFLERFPPQWEVEIHEYSSWSCFHGVERWRSNCGCNTHPGWSQQWRAPLRESLDEVRDAIRPLAAATAESLGLDLDAARNEYIGVILSRERSGNSANLPAAELFLKKFAPAAATPEQRRTVLKLMEMERQALLMFTSCGWFFNDIGGIETVQIVAYASRVLQLAAELFGPEAAALEERFVAKLEQAKSNLPEVGDGAAIYRKQIVPMRVGLEQVGAHYALSSMFTSYPEDANVFCYGVHRQSYDVFNSGRARLALGRALVTANITEDTAAVMFAVLHLGDHIITGAVRRWSSDLDPRYDSIRSQFRAAMTRAEITEAIHIMDRTFTLKDGQPAPTYSLSSLFQDEQRRVLNVLLTSTLAEVEAGISAIYETQASLLHFLSERELPKPRALLLAANYAVNAGLRRALQSEPVDGVAVRELLEVAASDKIDLDQQELSYLAGARMKQAMLDLQGDATRLERVENALTLARTITALPFETRIWQAQNLWNELLIDTRKRSLDDAWKEKFLELGRALGICPECLLTDEESISIPPLRP